MKKLAIEDVKKTFKSSPIKFILTWLLLWWLFFVFNIIFGATISTEKIENVAADKVWIYFYIQDDSINRDELTTKIINITDTLQKNDYKYNIQPKTKHLNTWKIKSLN